jgi:signal peptidase II
MPGEKREKISVFFNNLSIIAAILLLDQLSKFIALKKLALYQSIPVIPQIFHITLVHNRGAAFGMLKGWVSLFILTSLVAIILIYFNLRNLRNQKPSVYSVSLCLILAGGIGNLIDRIFYGHVIDFLDFRIWPVFNIADSAITIGAILLGISILRSPGHQVTSHK